MEVLEALHEVMCLPIQESSPSHLPVILGAVPSPLSLGGSSVHQREITAVKMPGLCVDGQCLLSTCCMPGSFPATLASLIQLILPPTLGQRTVPVPVLPGWRSPTS